MKINVFSTTDRLGANVMEALLDQGTTPEPIILTSLYRAVDHGGFEPATNDIQSNA